MDLLDPQLLDKRKKNNLRDKKNVLLLVVLIIFGVSLNLGISQVSAAAKSTKLQKGNNTKAVLSAMSKKTTAAQRQAAANRAHPKGPQSASAQLLQGLASGLSPLSVGGGSPSLLLSMTPGSTPDYFGMVPNFANSPLPPNVNFIDPAGTGASAVATVQAGVVTALKIINSGSGYTTPTVNIAGYDGSGATADAAVTNGVINNVLVVTGGSGYTAPSVAINDPTGTGANVSAIMANGVITGFTINAGGSGYTAPTVAITDPTGTNAFGAATFSNGVITGLTLTNGGSGYQGIRKFVDSLPGLTAANANDLGQYLPVAIPDTTTYPGSDYYEISLVQYTEQLHRDLPATTLRGYVQTNTTDPTVSRPSYLGPTIIAQKDRPVRVKFTNTLATGTGGDLFIPVDTTVMGAGMGPKDSTGADCDPMMPGMPMNCAMYSQNRATLHLHGGLTPWISDGTPHQWTTPAGEVTQYPKGVSVQYVPDMWYDPVTHVTVPAGTAGATNDPGDGSLTFYYTNQQSARLMFYHDHAYGITRLNVYSGEAAGYLLQDQMEQTLVNSGIIPADQFPLIIQDKAFVPGPNQMSVEDPTWNWGSTPGTVHTGDLWFPHVYMPNQNPADAMGANAMGRWDYGPWFWPPFVGLANGPVANPLAGSTPEEGPTNPGTPNPSLVPEAFVDTPLVNGTAYPFQQVGQKAYRFRILNASNDRTLNLQLYYAASNGMMWDANGNLVDPNAGEVSMVPAVANTPGTAGYPVDITDGRAGGVPDVRTAGPKMIQIGTEGGFLPAPVVQNNTPIGYNYNRRDITVLNVSTKNVMLGPAERADVIVDFSQVPDGTKIILYNDSPAPVPAFDPRNDYYTGDPDQTSTGGAPTTLPGYGPNTRTIMQFQVSSALGTAPAYDLNALNNAFASTSTTQGVFAASQDPIIVPQEGYNSAYNASFPNNNNAYVRISDTTMTYTPLGGTTPVTVNLEPKAIQELFETQYGRMNATLGVELPNTTGINQTTIPLGYIDPTTEKMGSVEGNPAIPIGSLPDGTQIWKITHNGVDTHAIHFHLFNVQLINRVGWDGMVKPPDANELGWKDTVRMNPLEDAIVAFKPIAPTLPWGVPDSVRSPDVTRPASVTYASFDPATGNPITVSNAIVNYGWEYVWHCHLLGHEENDMMRPIVFRPIVAQTDTIAPTISAIVAPSPNGAGWNNTSPVNVNFTAIDNAGGSGVASITYSASGATTIAPTTVNGSTASVAISAEGTTTVSYFATDVANNSSVPQSVNVNLDISMPTLTWGTPTPAPNGAGWNTTAVSVPWTAADAISGVATPGTSGTLVISTSGTNQTGQVTIVDVAGNSATFTSPAFNIDTVAPTMTAPTTPAANVNGWNNTPVTVNFAATDNVGGSGVASITYSATGATTIAPTTVNGSTASVPVSAQGITTFSYFATDVAGNVGTTQTLAVKLDFALPTLAWGTPTPAPNAAGWNNTPVNVPYTAADALSGVASSTPANPVVFSSQGSRMTQTVTVVDLAGNSATFTTPQISIDFTAPSLTVATNPTSATRGRGNVRVTISGTGTDALSGIVRPSGTYTITDSLGNPVSGNFNLSRNGSYSFSVNLSRQVPQGTPSRTYTITTHVLDNAGNTGTATTTFVVN